MVEDGDAERAQALREKVQSFERRSSDVTALAYGPLPPYSFAS